MREQVGEMVGEGVGRAVGGRAGLVDHLDIVEQDTIP